MTDELTVILHCCFNASYDEVKKIIEPFRHEFRWLETKAVQQIQIRGNFSICSYIGNRRYVDASPFSSPIEIISPNTQIPKQLAKYKKWSPNSDSGIVEIKPLNDADRKLTEVKITCYDSRVKEFYEELKLALLLNFKVLPDVELGLQEISRLGYPILQDNVKREYKKSLGNVPSKSEDRNVDVCTTPPEPQTVNETTVNKKLSREEVELLLSNAEKMREYHKDYSPDTAKYIYETIPSVWPESKRKYGRLSPVTIGKKCNISATTVGRYLKAFVRAGITKIEIDGYEIRIPYTPKFRKSRQKHQIRVK